jgi:hypothetical protein
MFSATSQTEPSNYSATHLVISVQDRNKKKHREVYASVWRTHLRNHFIILVATFPRLICIAKEVETVQGPK